MMSTDDEGRRAREDEGRVIEIKSTDNIAGEEDSPKLSQNSEMEQALQEAMESVEKREAVKSRLPGREMKQDERDHFQNRIKELHMQLMEKTKELDTAKDNLLRVQADMENYKKRVMRENADRFNYGNEEIARAFLDVLDNLQRALEHAESTSSSTLVEGVTLTLKNMEQTFERFDVKPVKALGEKFDPNYHEAMAQACRDDVEPGTIVNEHQRGYMLKDRLLRPSQVVVSAKPPENEGG